MIIIVHHHDRIFCSSGGMFFHLKKEGTSDNHAEYLVFSGF